MTTLAFQGNPLGLGGITLTAAQTDNPKLVNVPAANGTMAVIVPVPQSATSAGTVGQIAYDQNHFYVCINTNTWVRATLSNW